MTTQFWSGFAVAIVALFGVAAYAYWGSTVVDNQHKPPAQEIPNPTDSEAQTPERVGVSGTIVCLPKKGSGPHTLECAYGLRADSGEHYGLKNLFEDSAPWPLDVGDRASIEGWIEAPEANTSYDIVGVIDVDTFEKL